MNTKLESGLTLAETQPDCVNVTFTSSKQGAFDIGADDRGRMFAFDRLNAPAVFVEVAHTLPGAIRGNHVHAHCDEKLHVVSGEVEMYLLCEHKQHVYMRVLKAGDVVLTPKGTPHALRSISDSECVVLFENDPRNDRDRVQILAYPQ